MRFQFFQKISESLFWQLWDDGPDNEEVVVDLDVTCEINLMSHCFNEIQAPIDQYLSLVHSVQVSKKLSIQTS